MTFANFQTSQYAPLYYLEAADAYESPNQLCNTESPLPCRPYRTETAWASSSPSYTSTTPRPRQTVTLGLSKLTSATATSSATAQARARRAGIYAKFFRRHPIIVKTGEGLDAWRALRKLHLRFGSSHQVSTQLMYSRHSPRPSLSLFFPTILLLIPGNLI